MTDNNDLDTEALIFRQLDRVMRTASLDLDNFTESNAGQTKVLKDTDTWSHRVLMSTLFLDSFLDPIKTEEDQERIDKAYDNAEEEYNGAEDFLRFYRAKNMFRENVKVLHEKNFVFQESDDLVIEDESEEKLEPESSEVDEEVIE
ncbi:MAG: hypothetical protein ABEJ83_05670 [Candidatus Nanohaloarchaea archaeon]